MDREKLGWWLGIVVFALGIALLAFTFYSAFMDYHLGRYDALLRLD